ncbi:MAG: exodeoxyribonuclease VII large subunit [Gemmatimonadaceae bacterium]|nr:exodeoxyribonuclease VII large subunit [Gemmatimonadaceae bacterium]
MLAPGESPDSAISVLELNEAAKAIIEGAIQRLWVKGEISNFTKHRNGHWYFSLKDASAQLPCVIWSRDVRRLPTAPTEGMTVMARGQLTVYPAQGKMQFMIDALEAEGEGLWKKAFDETKARLTKDGLTDPSRKRRLPRFPRTVAVITSPDGAALRDIIAVVRRRHPGVSVVVIPAAVQGETAPDSLVWALDRLSRWVAGSVSDSPMVSEAARALVPDLLIIGRGGGSREDLWAFNDERVARAIAACPIPTISAVGHETDVTIADLVADLRAATPSVAAESAVPVLVEVQQMLRNVAGMLTDALEDQVAHGARELRQRADGLAMRAGRVVERRRARVQQLAGRIEALSPVAVLARGFSVARGADGGTLGRRAAFTIGDTFDLLLHDGRVRARTESVHDDAPHLRETP